jgi:class 3 adenylate cyclase
MDVGDWLRSLGLAQCEAKFRDNAIGMEILADWKTISLNLGHCLVTASARSRRSRASVRRSLRPNRRSRPKQDAAERRPITVMFCDLVGSTSLAARLDSPGPADW